MDYATYSHQRYVAAIRAVYLTEVLHFFCMTLFEEDDFKPYILTNILSSDGVKYILMK
jgi:hypothetical protein